MSNLFKLPLCFMFGIPFLLMVGCEQQASSVYTFQDSEEIAKLFVLNSASYSHSGRDLTLLDSNTLACENCFIFVFSFQSAYNGYGDRTATQANYRQTENIIDVVVQGGKVQQATINNEWNELLQRKLVGTEVLNGKETERITTYYCSDPRPHSCDDAAEPVCGSDRQEYSSACVACSKKSVKWFTQGQCDLGYQQRVMNDLNQGRITKDSGPVLVVMGWNLN